MPISTGSLFKQQVLFSPTVHGKIIIKISCLPGIISVRLRQLNKPTSISVSCLFILSSLSGCFRYQRSVSTYQDFEKAQNLKETDPQNYCFELNELRRVSYPNGEMLFQLYLCSDSGAVKDLDSRIVLQEAAKCGHEKALEIARKMGIEIHPTPRQECELCILPQLTAAPCGIRQEITPLGFILSAPIWIPVGTVVLVGAILTIPICVITSPFHGSRCM